MKRSILFKPYLKLNQYKFNYLLLFWLVNLTNNNLTISQNGNKNE
jgi:hypothetical protein